MSFVTQHFINGEEIRPVNADDIGFKLDWTGDAEEAELTVDSIILANRAKEIVNDHIANGMGIFEGIPYTVQVGTVTLEYYIDLTENPRVSGEGDDAIEVTIKRRRAVDWFHQQASGLSFEALNITHPISLIDIPYLIVRDNQAEMLLSLLISAYTLTKALIEGVQALVEAATDFIKLVFVGTGVMVGQILSAVLLLVARLAYVALLVIALIELTKQIMEIIFPPIRKLKGSTILELCTKGCTKLGYTFSSTIIQGLSQLAILPVPLKKGNESIFTNLFTLDNGSYTKGYPTARDTTPTLGILLNKLEDIFNAKIRIVGTTVHLERRDFWILNSGLQIKNMLTLQDTRTDEWTYNLGEAWKRYYLHYRVDQSDTHTLDRIDATDCEYSTEPVNVVNADLLNIKGLVDINIPFAFGIRKDSLSFVEEFCIPFAKLADEVVQFFGGESNLEAKILGRIGVTQISQQYFTVSKLLYQTSGKQPENYLTKIGANVIYQTYHTINQVKENFKRIYNTRIPFSTSNFETLLDNNYVTDQFGNSLEVLTFSWVNESKEAEIEYSILSNEAQNTKTILIDA